MLPNFAVIILAFLQLMTPMMAKIPTAVNTKPAVIMIICSRLIVSLPLTGTSSGLSSDPTGNKADMTNE